MAARTKKPAPPTDPDAPAITHRWLGDETRYTNGIPNRDITTDDAHLSEEALEEAIAAGTHERIER
jgi:hypothetical protein